ncbi:CPBP family intramembrane glutamic endopeptidase [Apilactobacillus ozensis]|uniref:CAAX prenyl protease 2/Lysostaphin resistance protein A-like domain-containing protein n=1 Tax=Apilactobacillus ozensis DSM 23829 = JCM 17196 TaxID=1423781 RepID=A0A0R2AT21_9LACO|nr:type II CAAX endopeptidase family protein [Apilactobacillus ozensis]KRM69738.1 hypothetical protein FD06_GL000911 [Apilactobacillus ozensis DSM 23829 = JCM 17196]MCK8607089.1 CPBP family intramembrane metalloprotease [Apilactobacillus ozensis]
MNSRLKGSEIFRNALIFFGMFVLVLGGFQFLPLSLINDHSGVLKNILASVAYFAIYGVLIWLSIACYKKYGRHSINQKLRPYDFKMAIMFYGISIILEMVLSVLNMVIYNKTTSSNQQAINEMLNRNHLTLILMLFGLIILSPILEELVFRGILMDSVFQPGAKWLPIVISGALFGLAHSPGFNIFFILTYFEMGFFMAYVYRKTGNIKANITMHMLNNLISSIGIIQIMFQK